MTLRGEKIQTDLNFELRQWMRHSDNAVADLMRAIPREQRQTTIKIEGRDTRISTILSAIHYHMTEEYPYLLVHEDAHSLTAIYASNMNDQFQIMRLRETLKNEEKLLRKVDKLARQLESIPSNQEGNI